MVHGRNGWPARVDAGAGPERSMPSSRRRPLRARSTGGIGASGSEAVIALINLAEQLLHAFGGRLRPDACLLAAAPGLRLDLALRERTLAHGHAQRATQQLGVGELLARAGV